MNRPNRKAAYEYRRRVTAKVMAQWQVVRLNPECKIAKARLERMCKESVGKMVYSHY